MFLRGDKIVTAFIRTKTTNPGWCRRAKVYPDLGMCEKDSGKNSHRKVWVWWWLRNHSEVVTKGELLKNRRIVCLNCRHHRSQGGGEIDCHTFVTICIPWENLGSVSCQDLAGHWAGLDSLHSSLGMPSLDEALVVVWKLSQM